MLIVNDLPLDYEPGMTVRDILKRRNYIWRMIAVFVNGELVPKARYDTHKVRFLQLVLSAGCAGVAGGLSCINFEIVTDENVSALRSGGPRTRILQASRRSWVRQRHPSTPRTPS